MYFWSSWRCTGCYRKVVDRPPHGTVHEIDVVLFLPTNRSGNDENYCFVVTTLPSLQDGEESTVFVSQLDWIEEELPPSSSMPVDKNPEGEFLNETHCLLGLPLNKTDANQHYCFIVTVTPSMDGEEERILIEEVHHWPDDVPPLPMGGIFYCF